MTIDIRGLHLLKAHLCRLLTHLQAKIPLEASLSINSFVASNNEESTSGEYHLRAVAHHIGDSLFLGHYTACGKRTIPESRNEEQWVFFDDLVGVKIGFDYVTDACW